MARVVMRSNPVPTYFYFPTRIYFTILYKIFDFLRSLNLFEVYIRVIISEIYKTIHLNIYLLAGVLAMSKRCRHRVCPDWVNENILF